MGAEEMLQTPSTCDAHSSAHGPFILNDWPIILVDPIPLVVGEVLLRITTTRLA